MSTKKLISRKEAKEQRLTRFFTGIPCKQGHNEDRLTSSGKCLGCKRTREDKKYKQDPSSHKRYYHQNRETILIKQQVRDDARRMEKIQYGRKWRAINSQYAKNYRETNAGLYAFHSSLRRKQCKLATPHWASLDAIRQLYIECEQITLSTGVKYHVDHIIPLKGKNVCGLHVHNNLRIIPMVDNLTKRNKFDII